MEDATLIMIPNSVLHAGPLARVDRSTDRDFRDDARLALLRLVERKDLPSRVNRRIRIVQYRDTNHVRLLVADSDNVPRMERSQLSADHSHQPECESHHDHQ